METKISDLEKLEELILDYKKENDLKRKQVLYLNLVEESLKLVKKIVGGFYPIPNTVTTDDLIQVGAIGMLSAIKMYKYNETASFKTYLTKFIKGKILQFLRDKSNIVKLPRESATNVMKVKEAIDNLSTDTVSPSAQDISEYTKLPIEKVNEILSIEQIKNIISLDQNIYSADGMETLIDRIQDNEYQNFEEIYETKRIIEFALNKISEEEQKIIHMYYMEGLNKKTIALKLNISQMQVARIIKRALNKMYNTIKNEFENNI